VLYPFAPSRRSNLRDLRPAVMAGPGSAVTHASAIMHVLKDGLISIVAGCCHRPQVVSITDLGPCR